MKIFSGIIMLIGALITFIELIGSTTVMQQAASLAYVVGAYVTGRALENFIPANKANTEQNNKRTTNEKQKTTTDNYTHITIRRGNNEPKTVTREQWLEIKKKPEIDDYVVLELIKY